MTKRYGDVVALGGVDLSVPTGTALGLLGPNGAGKTTMVRALTTTLIPDEGRATVLGHDVVTEADAVRQVIGLAGQENLEMIGRLAHRADGRPLVPPGHLTRRCRRWPYPTVARPPSTGMMAPVT